MEKSNKQFHSIDEYIGTFPPEIQELLQKIRSIIKESAPNAKEGISYQMPTFKLNGNLIHFAAFKKHIGLYPTPTGIEPFENELAQYKTTKGAIQFPLDQPTPFDLIKRIVEYRVKQNTSQQK